ncbi:hypothetical protein ACIGCH_00675 [Pseudomonas helleri]|uniref:Helix-turn-helix domain-containing protein n=1 Tax=Pseudomonas helleri TaxID=1608996 RepID=A0A6A7YZX7_9PSED|nr:hypothetical protein [Pseudomonas helleri]MQT81135.1 hypothetical protein [Pseudomonas helleri]MQU26961.1 hypothetical protein [Pseudomonas helleri]
MTKQKDDLVEEAARLKAIYKQRKKLDPTLNQARIAEVCDWAGQSVVSQYMTGKIPLNLTALLKFSKALQFKPAEVSERLLKIYPFEDLEVPTERLLCALQRLTCRLATLLGSTLLRS